MIVSFFNTVELYNYLHFAVPLMEGSIVGSIFGIISWSFNRSIKNRKIDILSLVPVFILFISTIVDFIYSYNKP